MLAFTEAKVLTKADPMELNHVARRTARSGRGWSA